MDSYEIADEDRTSEFTMIYVMVAIGLFFAGKVMTFIIYKALNCPLTSWINDSLLWIVLGSTFVLLFIAYVRSFAYLEVKGEYWVVTQNRWFDSGHWYVHPGGDHVINLLHKKVRVLGLFKTKGETSQEAKTADATITVNSTVTVEPISPIFILLNEKNAEETALEFAKSTVESLIDWYTSYYDSETILKSGQTMTKWVQSWLDVDEELESLGIKVTVRIKKLDESVDVADARKETLKAHELRNAVDALSGVDCYLVYENTGEIVLDENGRPIIIPPDIQREESAAILLANKGKGKFDRSKDERTITVKVEGDPEALKALRFTGVLGNQDGVGGTTHH